MTRRRAWHSIGRRGSGSPDCPGIEEAALASWFPLGLAGCKGSDATVEGYQAPEGEDTTYEFAIVSPRYFAALRIPLLAGAISRTRRRQGSSGRRRQ